MNFAELSTEFVHLRQSLCTTVGENALSEISIQTPAGKDEASFLRLIAWSYVLNYEAGRVTIPYLIKLPSGSPQSREDLESTRGLVHDLRTWSFHNLNFSTEHGRGISTRTGLWFTKTSGSNPPNNIAGWRSCFESLCTEVCSVVRHCRSAVGLILANPEDGERVTSDLRHRLDRNWPAYRFDGIVSDVVTRIGQSIDIPKFRQPRLSKWREHLESIPEGDEPDTLIVNFIERDVLDYFQSVLPINGNHVMSTLGLSPGPDVGKAMNDARRLYAAGLTEPDKLLAQLREDYHKA